jgi:hypothetical protein
MRLEDQAMALLHLSPVQLEFSGSLSSRTIVPPIGKQHIADIHKQCCNRDCFFHSSSASNRSIHKARSNDFRFSSPE